MALPEVGRAVALVTVSELAAGLQPGVEWVWVQEASPTVGLAEVLDLVQALGKDGACSLLVDIWTYGNQKELEINGKDDDRRSFMRYEDSKIKKNAISQYRP